MNIELIARAIIVNENKILLCQAKGNKYYFLPGGHIEFGEHAIDTLKRELKEELNAKIKQVAFLQTIENIFVSKGKTRHEVNLLFLASLKTVKSKSLENHISFKWIETKKLKNIDLKPKIIKDLIVKS